MLDRNEVRAGLWTAIVAFVVLTPVFAGASAALSGGPGGIGGAWQAWLASGGYLPWNILLHEPRSLLASLVASLAAGAYMWRLAGGTLLGTQRLPAASGKGEYGTSRWRSPGELGRTFSLWRPGSKVSGVLVAQAGGATAWVHEREEHVLLIGSTGSGKSRRVILPTIGVIGEAARESMIVTDPKGELYLHTAGWLRRRGYEVVLVDLREPRRGSRWNPIEPVVAAAQAGRLAEAAAHARDVAHAIVFSEESAKTSEPVWTQTAVSLATAAILGVASGRPPGGPEGRWPAPEERHMASVYASVAASGAQGAWLDRWMELFPSTHPAAQAYQPVRLSTDRTRDSILTVTTAALSLWADPDVAWLTSAQDFDLADPGRRRTAVFLVVPDERAARHPLATLFVQQSLQALVTLAGRHGGRLPVRVNMLLDEFANLPALKDFDHAVTVARGRGVRLLIAVQDLAQLRMRYGEAAGVIKGNCGLWVYLLTADLETAEEISGKLGTYTAEESRREGLLARPLLYPDEVMRWPAGEALLIQAREAPARVRLPDLSAWRRAMPDIQEPSLQGQGRATYDPVPVWVLAERLYEILQSQPQPDDEPMAD